MMSAGIGKVSDAKIINAKTMFSLFYTSRGLQSICKLKNHKEKVLLSCCMLIL